MDTVGLMFGVTLLLGVVVKQTASTYDTCEPIRECQIDFGRNADAAKPPVICTAYRRYFMCVEEASIQCQSAADPKFMSKLDRSRSECRKQCPDADDCDIRTDVDPDETLNQGGSIGATTGSTSGNTGGLTGHGQRGDNSKGDNLDQRDDNSAGGGSEDEDDIMKSEYDTEEDLDYDEAGEDGDINSNIMSPGNATEVPSPEPESGNKGVTSHSAIPLLLSVMIIVLSWL